MLCRIIIKAYLCCQAFLDRNLKNNIDKKRNVILGEEFIRHNKYIRQIRYSV